MGIGRQSLYGAFGDKRTLYLEALDAYQRRTTSGHLRRLSDGGPIEGIENLLLGLVAEDDQERALGCMGVGSVGEFGVTDAELNARRQTVSDVLHKNIVLRIREGQQEGKIDTSLDPGEAAAFVLMTMTGLQLAARGGASSAALKAMARFAADRLKC